MPGKRNPLPKSMHNDRKQPHDVPFRASRVACSSRRRPSRQTKAVKTGFMVITEFYVSLNIYTNYFYFNLMYLLRKRNYFTASELKLLQYHNPPYKRSA